MHQRWRDGSVKNMTNLIGSKSKKKILIVDDGLAIRHLTESIFAQDYETESSADGEEAIVKLAAFRPDLILLDVEMPKLDGLETCRRIRADPRFRFTKIVFVSGNISLVDRLAGYRAGGDDYVTKPYDRGELFAKVKTLLRLKNEEELNHLKSNFIALISHETRTPVNGILGCAQLLKKITTGKSQKLAEGVLQSTRRLHELIEKILLFSKLQSSTDVILFKQKVEIAPLVQEQLQKLEEDLEQKNVVVNLTEKAVPSVNACPGSLGKAFRLVLENAVEFSPVGGEIGVDISMDKNNCVVLIGDQGAGITDERLDKIFDGFAIEDIAHHHSGLGISLAIARQIFNQHGGNIHAENRDDAGAVFTVILPLEIRNDQED